MTHSAVTQRSPTRVHKKGTRLCAETGGASVRGWTSAGGVGDHDLDRRLRCTAVCDPGTTERGSRDEEHAHGVFGWVEGCVCG